MAEKVIKSGSSIRNAFGWLFAKLNIFRLIRYALMLAFGYWLYQNTHKDLPLDTLNNKYSFPDSKFINVNDIEVHYRESGKGETILLLHDAGSNLRTWDKWTESLAKNYRVIAIDMAGFGLTGPHRRSSYSSFMYAGLLEEFIKSKEIKQLHLVGNGMGAQTAWFYAAEHPDKVKKLILLDAEGFEKKKTTPITLLAKTPLLNRIFWYVTPKYFIRLNLEDIYADDSMVTDTLVRSHFELFLYPGNRKAYTDRIMVSENRPPVLDFIPKITAPTLILWGAEDTRISPEYAYEFHKKMRTAELKIYKNTGHWPQEENPEETVKDVRAFLEGKF